MPEFLETTIDKFIFRIAADRLYTAEGMWAKLEGHLVRIGLSDFVQQHNGDVAFAEVKAAGTELGFGDEAAVIETIKVDISLGSPVTGRVAAVNPELETAPEAINLDPYGAGWLALIKAADWEADQGRLLDPPAYFELVKRLAREEIQK